MCQKRNRLLLKGLDGRRQFTFPQAFREVADDPNFREQLPDILDLIFLQPPGREMWLNPEFFDASRPESRFFIANPREFYQVAGEVLGENLTAPVT